MQQAILDVLFFSTEQGHEPVREWLKTLPQEDRKSIGEDIKLVQWRWPLGMPWVRKLKPSLWEIRTSLDHRTARILFTIQNQHMILLHGFIKKTQKTCINDLDLAIERKKLWLQQN